MLKTLPLAALLLAGCAAPLDSNQARVTIESNPPGATIRYHGTGGQIVSAQLPYTVTWRLSEGKTVANFSTTWVSGASTLTHLRLVPGKDNAYFLVQRPPAPGIEGDVQWAIHLQQRVDANAEIFAAALRSYNENKAKPAALPFQSINCTSTKRSATVVDTNCF